MRAVDEEVLMAIIGGRLGEYILTKAHDFKNDSQSYEVSEHYDNTSEDLKFLFGDDLDDQVRDKVVIDYGCGIGNETVQIAKWGARKVIGIDIQDRFLKSGRRLAIQQNVGDICEFSKSINGKADIIISKDAFEHYDNPTMELNTMYRALNDDGYVLISFGPVWYNPNGGHYFSVFPWAHLICSEKSLLSWRAKYKSDGARTFSEVEGGLNKMTIKRFLKIVNNSPFTISSLKVVPVRKLRFIHCRITREFSTSVVNCRLIKAPEGQ